MIIDSYFFCEIWICLVPDLLCECVRFRVLQYYPAVEGRRGGDSTISVSPTLLYSLETSSFTLFFVGEERDKMT